MTIEYKMTLKQEIKIQPIVVMLLNKKKIAGAFACALLSIIFIALSVTVSSAFIVPGMILVLLALNLFLYWVRRSRVRSQRMAALYRSQETKVLTYTLSDNNGVIRDYCNELKTFSDWKRSAVKRVFTFNDTIFVIFNTGSVSVYPDTKPVREFWGIER